MIHAEIIAVGRLRDKALLGVWDDYAARMQGGVTLHEIEGKNAADEEKKILERLAPRARLYVLDERGKSLSSREFSGQLEHAALDGLSTAQFVIGGADGLSDEIRAKADFLLSFGEQTWPHMLARIMLLEQIYRARQILAGHPYHRD